MIDAKALGLELGAMVKAQLEPILSRLDELESRVRDIPTPIDLSADLASLKEAVAAIEIPELPQLPEMPDVPGLVLEAVRSAVTALPGPEKGVGLAGAFIDRDGDLVVTLSNGEVTKLGPVVGKDGDPGSNGLGFDDLDVSYDGEKTVTLKFTRGDVVKEFPIVMPIIIDRGVYREAGDYKTGDAVTWGGSLWIAQKDTSAKPDASDDWRLSVKRGRDGKDGMLKEAKAHEPVRVGVPTRIS